MTPTPVSRAVQEAVLAELAEARVAIPACPTPAAWLRYLRGRVELWTDRPIEEETT